MTASQDAATIYTGHAVTPVETPAPHPGGYESQRPGTVRLVGVPVPVIQDTDDALANERLIFAHGNTYPLSWAIVGEIATWRSRHRGGTKPPIGVRRLINRRFGLRRCTGSLR
jgi:hypothetical protein